MSAAGEHPCWNESCLPGGIVPHFHPGCFYVFCAPGHERCNATRAEHDAKPELGHAFLGQGEKRPLCKHVSIVERLRRGAVPGENPDVLMDEAARKIERTKEYVKDLDRHGSIDHDAAKEILRRLS